jgi:hypothetical protein
MACVGDSKESLMKLSPKLFAAIVTLAAFVLTINGAWAENLSNAQPFSNGSKKGSGKQGPTSSASRMGTVSGKQPHKQARAHFVERNFSFAAENSGAIGQGSATKAGTKAGKVVINEIKIRPKRLTVHPPPK